jgi:DNA-binding NarL/FixJ family response regulator
MVKILIAEQSYLVRKGLIHVLKQFPEVTGVEVLGSHLGLSELTQHFCPHILIINTTIAGAIAGNELEKLMPESSKTIHLISTMLPPGSPPSQISIYDSKMAIAEKLLPVIRLFEKEVDEAESEELTQREKLILTNVALGLTNKEIASKLHISAHTVISHRKNITRKLDIKSVSGLTVYAILNGLLKMDDIS